MFSSNKDNLTPMNHFPKLSFSTCFIEMRLPKIQKSEVFCGFKFGRMTEAWEI